MKKWKGFAAGFLAALLCMALVGTAFAMVGKVPAELEYSDIKVTIGGNPVSMADANGVPVEPFAVNGTTYLPVRSIAEALGLTPTWDQETSTVKLNWPQELHPVYITRTGKHYHYNNTCNGGTYWEVTYKTAIGFGLTPCDKCVLIGN